MINGNYCPTCKAPIHYITGPSGKSQPVNVDGSMHQCPIATPVKEAISEPVIQTQRPGIVPSGMVVSPVTSPETIIRTISDRPDSICIGSASKGGELKIYFNSDRPEEAERLVMNAFKIRDMAQRLHSPNATFPEPVPLSRVMS